LVDTDTDSETLNHSKNHWPILTWFVVMQISNPNFWSWFRHFKTLIHQFLSDFKHFRLHI